MYDSVNCSGKNIKINVKKEAQYLPNKVMYAYLSSKQIYFELE